MPVLWIEFTPIIWTIFSINFYLRSPIILPISSIMNNLISYKIITVRLPRRNSFKITATIGALTNFNALRPIRIDKWATICATTLRPFFLIKRTAKINICPLRRIKTTTRSCFDPERSVDRTTIIT